VTQTGEQIHASEPRAKDRTRSTVSGAPLSRAELQLIDAWWRAANYLSVYRGDEACVLAYDVFTHRLVGGQIAAMTGSLRGFDVLVMTGGIGEGSPEVRADVAAALGYLGVRLDASTNAAARSDADVSAVGATVRTVVITAGEDAEIARQVRSVLSD